MTDVATLDGVSITEGHASVRVSCAPTYMFTHRFGEADASGHRRCSCGATTDKSHFLYGAFVACSHHAPSIWCAPYEPAFARGLARRLMGEADGVTSRS